MVRIRDRINNQNNRKNDLEYQLINKLQEYLNKSFSPKIIEILEELKYLRIGSYAISLYEYRPTVNTYYLTQEHNGDVLIIAEMYVRSENKEKIYIKPIMRQRTVEFLEKIEDKNYLETCINKSIKNTIDKNKIEINELGFLLDKLKKKGY